MCLLHATQRVCMVKRSVGRIRKCFCQLSVQYPRHSRLASGMCKITGRQSGFSVSWQAMRSLQHEFSWPHDPASGKAFHFAEAPVKLPGVCRIKGSMAQRRRRSYELTNHARPLTCSYTSICGMKPSALQKRTMPLLCQQSS
jgi:hypothetical protein